MALEAGARLDLLNTPTRAAGRSKARTPAYRYGIVSCAAFVAAALVLTLTDTFTRDSRAP